MRISDWSSDVCSSDLFAHVAKTVILHHRPHQTMSFRNRELKIARCACIPDNRQIAAELVTVAAKIVIDAPHWFLGVDEDDGVGWHDLRFRQIQRSDDAPVLTDLLYAVRKRTSMTSSTECETCMP